MGQGPLVQEFGFKGGEPNAEMAIRKALTLDLDLPAEAKEKMLFTAKPLRLSDPPPPIRSDRPATTPRPFALRSVTRHERWRDERRQQLEAEERERQHRMNVKAMPLPATFTIDAGERISRSASGMQVRLYSDHPFPWREAGGPRDDFDRLALQELREQPDQPIHEFSEKDGVPVLRCTRGGAGSHRHGGLCRRQSGFRSELRRGAERLASRPERAVHRAALPAQLGVPARCIHGQLCRGERGSAALQPDVAGGDGQTAGPDLR